MSKNLQQVQVSSGVITPDKLFTDNILETRLKAAEEAKMLDKRLASAEKEGELSRDLTKAQYEAQNQLARDKLAADVADQTARLALLKDQDARQAALHGMQLGEAGMKLDKLAKADAAERAYVSAISNPEMFRREALKSTSGYKELEEIQKGVDANIAGFRSSIEADLKKEQEQVANSGGQLLTPEQFDMEAQKRLDAIVTASKSALPSVLNPDTRNSEYTQNKIFDTLSANADKQQVQDAMRSRLARAMGTAPTEEQVNAALGNTGVDYAAQQKAMDDKYSEQIKGITGILKESITPSVIRNISTKPSTTGLDIKDVTDSGIFTDGKKEFTNAVVGAKILAEQNPEAIPAKYLDAALSYAAYQGVKGADNEGKVKFSMSPEDLFIAAKEALPMVVNSEKSTGQQFSPQQALSMLNEMYSASPNARATYSRRIANALYGDSGANLPKATSAVIGSTYDAYTAEQKAKNNQIGRQELNKLLQDIEAEGSKNEVHTTGMPRELLKMRAAKGDEEAIRLLDKNYRTGNTISLMSQQELPISEVLGGAVRLLKGYSPQEAAEASGFSAWKRRNDAIRANIESLKESNLPRSINSVRLPQ